MQPLPPQALRLAQHRHPAEASGLLVEYPHPSAPPHHCLVLTHPHLFSAIASCSQHEQCICIDRQVR